MTHWALGACLALSALLSSRPANAQGLAEHVGRPYGASLSLLEGSRRYPDFVASLPFARSPVSTRHVLTATLSTWARVVGAPPGRDRVVLDVAFDARSLFGTASDGDFVASPGNPTLEARVGGTLGDATFLGTLGVTLPVSGALDRSHEDGAVIDVAVRANAYLEPWLAQLAVVGALIGFDASHTGRWHLFSCSLRGALGGRVRDDEATGSLQVSVLGAARLWNVLVGTRMSTAGFVTLSIAPFVRVELDGPFVELALLWVQRLQEGTWRESLSFQTGVGVTFD